MPPREDWGIVLLLALIGHVAFQIGFIFGLDRTAHRQCRATALHEPGVGACDFFHNGARTPQPAHPPRRPRHAGRDGDPDLGRARQEIGSSSARRSPRPGCSNLLGRLHGLRPTAHQAARSIADDSLDAVGRTALHRGWQESPNSCAPIGAPCRFRPGSAWCMQACSRSGLAYLLWYRGVRVIGQNRTSVYQNLVPVVALLSAWLWLSETPTAAAGDRGLRDPQRGCGGAAVAPPLSAVSDSSARPDDVGSAQVDSPRLTVFITGTLAFRGRRRGTQSTRTLPMSPGQDHRQRTMDINEVGFTAFVIASIRALEEDKSPALFSDPYAKPGSRTSGRWARPGSSTRSFPPSTTMVRFRTRYFNRFPGARESRPTVPVRSSCSEAASTCGPIISRAPASPSSRSISAPSSSSSRTVLAERGIGTAALGLRQLPRGRRPPRSGQGRVRPRDRRRSSCGRATPCTCRRS